MRRSSSADGSCSLQKLINVLMVRMRRSCLSDSVRPVVRSRSMSGRTACPVAQHVRDVLSSCHFMLYHLRLPLFPLLTKQREIELFVDFLPVDGVKKLLSTFFRRRSAGVDFRSSAEDRLIGTSAFSNIQLGAGQCLPRRIIFPQVLTKRKPCPNCMILSTRYRRQLVQNMVKHFPLPVQYQPCASGFPFQYHHFRTCTRFCF